METEVITFLEQFFALLQDLIAVPFIATGVVALVALVKSLPFIPVSWSAGTMQLVAQIVLWGIYAMVVKFGPPDAGATFQEWFNAIVQVLTIVLPLGLSLFGVERIYNSAKARGVRWLGFSRSVARGPQG